MQDLNDKIRFDIMESFAKISVEQKKYSAMTLAMNMADEVGGDPITAIGILECAKIELWNEVNKKAGDHNADMGYDGLVN